MHYTPEHGSRSADVQSARAADGSTTFINYGKEGDAPVAAGTLQDIWDSWKDRGVTGTSVVPHHKVYKSASTEGFNLTMPVSEALQLIKVRADEAAGILAVAEVAEVAEPTDIDRAA